MKAWWFRVRARRAQRKRMDAVLRSIERRSPVWGRPDVDLLPGESWPEFVARVSHGT